MRDVCRARLVLEGAGDPALAGRDRAQRDAGARRRWRPTRRGRRARRPYQELNERHLDFHVSLVGLTGSPRLVAMAGEPVLELKLALAQVDRVRRNAHDQADIARSLVRLLENGDIDGAYEFLVGHLADAETRHRRGARATCRPSLPDYAHALPDLVVTTASPSRSRRGSSTGICSRARPAAAEFAESRPAAAGGADPRPDHVVREADPTILSIPFIIVTLGLFLLVINAGMLLLTSWLADQLDIGFHVDGFWSAVGGAIVITLSTWVVDGVLGPTASVASDVALPPPRSPGRYAIALVCLGNICRSPMADVVLTEHVSDAGLAGRVRYQLRHRRLARRPADGPAGRSDAAGGRLRPAPTGRGGSTRAGSRTTTSCSPWTGRTSPTSGRRGRRDDDRVRMFRDFDPVGPGGDVPDPYYGGDAGFEEVLEMVERTSAALVAALQRRSSHCDDPAAARRRSTPSSCSGTSVVATAPVAGGDTSTATKLRLSDGTTAIMKTALPGPRGLLRLRGGRACAGWPRRPRTAGSPCPRCSPSTRGA